ncbi:DUF4870 family protein [Niveispirillum fermenti]|uniref:DUF4870 family protein n=1 Tax=Niveispirillum fermenti TaxID=1233113 RepID=UPI003A894831
MSLERSRSDDSNLRLVVVIAYILYVIGFALIGLIMAYVKRPDSHHTPWHSHFTFIIRTFWIGLFLAVVGAVTTLIGIGYLILLAVTIWALVRCVVGLLRAIDGKPINNPGTWMV